MDDARKNCEFVANPQAKEFVPKDSTNKIPIKPRFVYIKMPLVVYQKKEEEVAHVSGYEEYFPEYSGASFDNAYWTEEVAPMDLTGSGYEEYLPEYSGASFDSTNWPEELAPMDLTGYEEYLPGYSGTSFDIAYWPEEVSQRDPTGIGYSGASSKKLYWPEEVGQYKQSGRC